LKQCPVIIPVILAGGSGSRLWPLSRESHPKQFLTLVGSHSLLQETVLRAKHIKHAVDPIIITHESHFFLCQDQIEAIQQSCSAYIIEPCSKNTAPAIALAAHYIQAHFPSNALMLVMPSDHLISDPQALNEAVQALTHVVEEHKLGIFGIEPSSPKTGYGYIEAGLEFQNNCYQVMRFCEKPSESTAQFFLTQRNYYWNAGLFLFNPADFLNELHTHAEDIAITVKKTFHASKNTGTLFRANMAIFQTCREESIDFAVMEKTSNTIMYPLRTQWSDLGSWASIADATGQDENHNVIQGSVITKDTHHCLIKSDEDCLIAAIGLKDQIIIHTMDAILIADKKHTEDVKQIVKQLKLENNTLVMHHKKVQRPWGYYKSLAQGPGYQVKQIYVKPGGSLSLQLHYHRSEHWTVVEGVAEVVNGDQVLELHKNESTYIPQQTQHRLSNRSQNPLRIIEVQVGDYLGEDDIVRLQDIYQRVPAE
jgi:mannose-1-phosphate guanylyltransferase / mannose-6-phosphate isomerase